MSKNSAFMEINRKVVSYREPLQRLMDFNEILTQPSKAHIRSQGSRCMDCGVPFCQSSTGCPIDNLIPEWNNLVYQGRWREALDRLHKTNNFPEFTGRVCPAPCEGACVLGIIKPAVTIKNIENAIIDYGFSQGWVQASPPKARTGKKVAIIGSGPAGLAAADQLNTRGHLVTVYEREDHIGGLLMYGIPNMKLDKQLVQRRLNLLKKEGIIFVTNADAGKSIEPEKILSENDAVILATGATKPQDLPILNRALKGIHFAMDFLTMNTKNIMNTGSVNKKFISTKGKNVIVIGGGDTGTDCIGTAIRQGCSSLINFELLSCPPKNRAQDNPWPEWPKILRTDYGHEEVKAKFGNDPRKFSILSKEFIGDVNGYVSGIKTVAIDWKKNNNGIWSMNEIAGSDKIWKAECVLLAMGFLGPENYLSNTLGISCDEKGNYQAAYGKFETTIPGVFTGGDCRRGQSLIVWAINEGRGAARECDRYLMGSTVLP